MRSARAALNFISQQEHNRLIPFMHIIKDPDRDPTPSTCDAIVTLDYTYNQATATTGIWTIPTADAGPETWAPTTGN